MKIHEIMCHECMKPTKNGLNEVRDFHGNSFSVCCDKCENKIRKMLDALYINYGGVKGVCGPYHSPHIQSIEHLEKLTKYQMTNKKEC